MVEVARAIKKGKVEKGALMDNRRRVKEGEGEIVGQVVARIAGLNVCRFAKCGITD